jgi:hypothetical protein
MIIFDLDGTLANCEHRRHFINPEKYPDLCEYSNYRMINGKPHIDLDGKASWRYKKNGEPFQHGFKSFYEACDKDLLIWPVKSMFIQNTHRDVKIWSGRCESVRKKTVRWIYNHTELCETYIDSILKMRPEGDYIPDDELKEKWLDEALSEGKKIDFVFDDRPKVIRMWCRRGIFVFNCCQHDEEF